MKYLRLMPALIVLSRIGVAQTVPAGSGVLEGTTLGADKHPEPAVKVYAEREIPKQIVSAETDSEGKYRMVLSRGRYRLHAEGARGERAVIGEVSVEDGKTTTLDLVLQVGAPAEPQFFDEPTFTIAGVKDNTYRGGHGSDNVLRSAEDLTEATASLTGADDAEPHHKLAEEYERSGHPVEAAKEFELAAKANPSEENIFDWGTELLSHRAFGAAVQVFGKGRDSFPESSRMLLGLASANYAEGLYSQASNCFFKATDLKPENKVPYLFLAKAQATEVVDLPGFEERMGRFVRLYPNDARANYYYGLTLLNKSVRTGDETLAERARQFFSTALSLDQHFAAASLQLGVIDAEIGKYNDAIRAYKRAIADDSTLEEAHYRLSEAYRVTGEDRKASSELATYRELRKSSSENREKQRETVQQFVLELQNTKK